VASTAEIVDCLEKLASAYPSVETTLEIITTNQLYVCSVVWSLWLSLTASVINIHTSWIAYISLLEKRTAAKVAGTSSFWELPETLVDCLRGEAVRHENLFFREGVLEKSEWMTLAKQFEDMGREHVAERVRQMLIA